MTSPAGTAVCTIVRDISLPTECLHCGNSLESLGRTPFCCKGCETVYHLLEERGLTRYYSLRNGPLPATAEKLFDHQNENFDYLDDSDFIARYATPDHLEMRFYLEGVHCAACVWLTEKLPEFVENVASLRLNLSEGVATIRLKSGGGFSQAAKELIRLGYRPHPVRSDESDQLRQKENRKHLIQMGIAAASAGNIMLLAVALYGGATAKMANLFLWASFFVYLPAGLYSAIPFYRSAWLALRNHQVSIDVPIALGLWVGTLVSIYNLITGSDQVYFDSLSALIFLLLSTRYLLRKVNERSLNTRKWVYFLAPSKARRETVTAEATEEVPTQLIKVGDIIQVFPGETFPVDGDVIEGESFVNRALLSGESEPVQVSVGSRVHAGTQNTQSPLRIQVVSSGAETRLGKLLIAVQEGLARQAPIVAFVDRVGQFFVMAVFGLTGLAFWVGLQVSPHEAFNRALAAAIIVCPCTFALATPLAMSLAMSRAARKGILIKGADLIERLSQIRTVVFDKTGTLTHGNLEVLQWNPMSEEATDVLIALEAKSAHPVAKAVQHYFEQGQPSVNALPLADFIEKSGWGVSATYRGERYELRRFSGDLKPNRVGPVVSVIGLYRGQTLIGRLEVGDRIRDDAKSTILRLKSMNLGVGLISGDSEFPVQAVAKSLDLDGEHVFAQQSPEGKAERIKKTPYVLMVGDGANDAVALSVAHASVAVQGGMEMSMQAAGVYSSKDGVGVVPDLLLLSRETMRVIRRNLVFAILYNMIGITAAVSGHVNPLFAAVLMPLSAFTVFTSTLVGTSALRGVFKGRAG